MTDARKQAEEALRVYDHECKARPDCVTCTPRLGMALRALLAASAPAAGEREEKKRTACSAPGCTDLADPRWFVHLPACDGHGQLHPPRPAPSPETPGTTYVEAHDGDTYTAGTDGGQDGGSDEAAGEGPALLGVQPTDGDRADDAPGGVPLAVPVLRSGETRGPVTPRPAQDAVREAAERADKAMRDVFGGVDQFGDYCGHPVMPGKLAYAVQALLAALPWEPAPGVREAFVAGVGAVVSGEAPGGEGKTCPGCGGLGWIPAGDEQAGCIDCNGTGHAPAPPSPAVAEGPLPEVPPAATEADALIRLAYDARFGGHEWQRRAHSYLWRDPKPSPAVAEAAVEWEAADEDQRRVPAWSRDTDLFERMLFRSQSATRALRAAVRGEEKTP